jgi:hypothetical protein
MNGIIGLGVVVAALVIVACGSGDATPARHSSATSSSSSSTPGRKVSLTEFAAAADKVCIATWSKVSALEDPDGNGGNKPLGLGRVVRQWADALAAITPPATMASEWAKAMGLLRRSGVRLEDAERLAAEGDPRSGAAQSEALWSLQPAAAEIVAGLGVPFKACFV